MEDLENVIVYEDDNTRERIVLRGEEVVEFYKWNKVTEEVISMNREELEEMKVLKPDEGEELELQEFDEVISYDRAVWRDVFQQVMRQNNIWTTGAISVAIKKHPNSKIKRKEKC